MENKSKKGRSAAIDKIEELQDDVKEILLLNK